jgi:ribosomal protein S18 acetylase RimI-like enzyme
VPIPDHIYRFWCALDDLFADVQPTPWGAVVTDGRFPRIWDANYARIDVGDPSLRTAEVERSLLPALERVGADVMHLVTFHHEAHGGLLAELSTRGHRLGWDLVMDADPAGILAPAAIEIQELRDGPELWGRVGDSLAFFGADQGEAVTQLQTIERDVLAPGGKRWFGVRDPHGSVVSLAALLVLDDTGYVDNVATFPEARGQGFASAVTSRIAAEARRAGVRHLCLLCDPDDDAVVRMYQRLGFREVGRLASTRGPVPPGYSTNL